MSKMVPIAVADTASRSARRGARGTPWLGRRQQCFSGEIAPNKNNQVSEGDLFTVEMNLRLALARRCLARWLATPWLVARTWLTAQFLR